MIQYSVGMSLGPSSSVESGVAVREIATGKLKSLRNNLKET